MIKTSDKTAIRTLGIGEFGEKLIHQMVKKPAFNSFYIAIDSDKTRLEHTLAHYKLLVSYPEQDSKIIRELFKDVDFLTIFIGLDNPKPFTLIAGKYAQKNILINQHLAQLKKMADSVIEFNQQQECLREQCSPLIAEKRIEEKLRYISYLPNALSSPSLIYVDLTDVRTILANMSKSDLIFASATGEGRIIKVINSLTKQLKQHAKIGPALISIQSGENLELTEVKQILEETHPLFPDNCTTIFSVSQLNSQNQELRVVALLTLLE